MKVAVACDHAGFPLKREVLSAIAAAGHEPIDLGTHDTQAVDYPDIARTLCKHLQSGQSERGILLCGSGVGVAVAANKLRGIRAGVCHDTYSARQGVEHDDLNVLALGARVIGPALAVDLVQSFLAAVFSTDERHRRRVRKIAALEGED